MVARVEPGPGFRREPDRKSTRLNSSHVEISYAVFCLKKKSSSSRQRRMVADLAAQLSAWVALVSAVLLARALRACAERLNPTALAGGGGARGQVDAGR